MTGETIAIVGLVLLMVVREVLGYKERIMLERLRKANSLSELETPQKIEEPEEEVLMDLADMPDLPITPEDRQTS